VWNGVSGKSAVGANDVTASVDLLRSNGFEFVDLQQRVISPRGW